MKTIITFIILMSLQAGIFLYGDTTKLSGEEVIKKVYFRPTGKDIKSTLKMTLINESDLRRTRKLTQFIKQYGDDEKKIMFFLSPADVRNTSFMSWSYGSDTQDEDQWIFLPALKRVKRISSDSKSDYFMGSDFTYDDLGDRHPDKDNHKILRTETYQDEECLIVESTSKNQDYMYSKTISWVIKHKWLDIKKEFYDKDGELLKILTVEKYKQVKNILIITHRKMHNIQKSHYTIMELSAIEINSGISDNIFTVRMMKRGL